MLEKIKFLLKINNVIGFILIATIILSPVGFIQILLGYLVSFEIERRESGRMY